MHALDTMRALASKAEVIHLNQGDVLFRTGETGTCMYGLLEGSVRLTWIDSAAVSYTHLTLPTIYSV